MKKDEIEVGATYSARVGGRTADVRIDSVNARGGWNATGVDSGKPVRIKDARQIRGAAGADGERALEAADDARAADAAGDDATPAAATDRPGKRGGKSARGVKPPKQRAPKEKTPRAKAPKERKPKAMGCLDAAAAILKAAGEPMRCKEMVAEMKDKGLWTTTAPTPDATLYSAILREIGKKGADARFRKTGRGHFALNTK